MLLRLLLCLPALTHAAVVASSMMRGGAPKVSEKLQAVQKSLEEQRKQDEASHEKMSCWCQTHLAEKQSALDDVSQQLQSLGSDVETTSASLSRLNIEVESHEKELADNQQDLSAAQALREKASSKFTDEEQTQVQNIDALSKAMAAIKSPHGTSELAVSSMASILGISAQPWQSQDSQSMLLQLRGQVERRQSPDVVFGVLKRMKASFEKDLADSRNDENNEKDNHEELVGAKTKQILSLKKHLSNKKQRLAESKVQVLEKKKLIDRYGGLRDADQELLVAMKEFCQDGDDSFQARHEEYQNELLALSKAQAEFAGTQLLAVGGGDTKPGYADELCTVALGITGKDYRAKAKAACEKARDGQTQDAADAAEALQDELTTEAKKLGEQKSDCERSLEDARNEAEQANEITSARAGAIDSDKQSADARIDALKAQSSSSDKAKSELADVRDAVHQAMYNIGLVTHNTVTVMQKVKEAAGPAAGSISTAIGHAEKLAGAAKAFDARNDAGAQKIGPLVDTALQAASKALIPLQMMRANAEEDALDVKRDQREHLNGAAVQKCNPAALASEAEKLQGFAEGLGNAASAWAYAALR